MLRLTLVPLSLAFLGMAGDFSGAESLQFTKRAVAFGPRPAGSQANGELRAYIKTQIRQSGGRPSEDSFTASTPKGPVPMQNLICSFPGTSGRTVVFSGHFDTKDFPGRHFVGANDGGASTGLLLELMRALASADHKDEIDIVWLDGEEAFGEWSDTNGTYGSRHLAAKWTSDGVLAKIRALINVDMIGDRELGIVQEENSTPALRSLVWQAAKEKGYGQYFLDQSGAIEDDHVPFLKAGVPAVDLIDFDYGPKNSFWHTDKDTLDKVSAHSLQVVGDVLMDVVRRLNAPYVRGQDLLPH
jgi:Zn-dependent M28 family amino/carboxypeptidase